MNLNAYYTTQENKSYRSALLDVMNYINKRERAGIEVDIDKLKEHIMQLNDICELGD